MAEPYKQAEVIEFRANLEFRRFYGSAAFVEPARQCLIEAAKMGVRPRWLIPHQPGKKIVQYWSRHLEFDPENVLTTLDFSGNMSAANLPFTLHHFTREEPRIQTGDVVLFLGVGSGMHSGGLLWRVT